MRVTSLGSGSSGNAYLIEAGPQGRTRILIDAGFPTRVLAERLRLAGSAPGQLQGVLVTHEHSDHILGLPMLIGRYKVPVFADPRTLEVLREIFTAGTMRSESGGLVYLEEQLSAASGSNRSALVQEELISISTLEEEIALDEGVILAQNTSSLEEEVVEVLSGTILEEEIASARRGSTIEEDVGPPQTPPVAGAWRALPTGTNCVIGDIEVHSFPVSHDAVAPCGYLLHAGGCRVCLVTDSGEVTPVMLKAMAQADLLILESNHDRARLLSGPYPYHLKQRILSPTGHLSNAQAAEAVLRTWSSDGLRWLWLAHLSRTNNTPKLALTSMQQALRNAGANLSQIHISVLGRDLGTNWDSARLWRDTHLWEM